MKILHIAVHLGDGAGKAIGGLARLGAANGDEHKILLLDEPKKMNHIDRCREVGVEILQRKNADEAIDNADVVILNWWGGAAFDNFIKEFPKEPCRVLLWAHKNGYFDPPLPDALVDACDGLLATTPYTLENPRWREKGELVWGFGDFEPRESPYKTDYSHGDPFTIGYVGMPGYKRFPPDATDYFAEVLKQIPNCRFILAGEADARFVEDVARRGLSGCVMFLGWVADVPRLLTTFDAFMYLTKPDIFATTENAVLEAQAAGLPIVASRVPLGKYLVDDCENGFLAGDAGEFAAAFQKLRESDILRRQLGAAAREKVIAVCDAQANLSRFNAACEKVLAAGIKLRNLKGA